MFWLARARPYQRTKRREPPGARATDRRTVAGRGTDGRGGGTLIGKTRKPTMGRWPRASFRNGCTTSGDRWVGRREGGRVKRRTRSRCRRRGVRCAGESAVSHGRNGLNNNTMNTLTPGKSQTTQNAGQWSAVSLTVRQRSSPMSSEQRILVGQCRRRAHGLRLANGRSARMSSRR